jgi:hypothetical protein
LEQLINNIKDVVRSELASKEKVDAQEQMLSPAQTCELFNPKISKVTLAKWTNNGLLKDYRIGGRVYYKYSEVFEAAKHLIRFKAKSQFAAN